MMARLKEREDENQLTAELLIGQTTENNQRGFGLCFLFFGNTENLCGK